MGEDLQLLLREPKSNRERIVEYLTETVMPQAIKRLNDTFSTRRLAKLGRSVEPLPTDTRQLSSYRTRLGTLLEYALSTEIDGILKERYNNNLFFTFAVAHEYPDFYLRNAKMEPVLKVEMKAVDADSDEQAARFDVPTHEIDPDRDFIIYVGWKWKSETLSDGTRCEHPHIFSYCLIPAIEIANERDKRLFEVGGNIEEGIVLVPSTKNPGTFVKDPGNYGKFWRIIHKSRRYSVEYTDHIKSFIKFQEEVDKLSPRNRLSGGT